MKNIFDKIFKILIVLISLSFLYVYYYKDRYAIDSIDSIKVLNKDTGEIYIIPSDHNVIKINLEKNIYSKKGVLKKIK